MGPWVQSPELNNLGMMTYAFNPMIQELEVERSEVQGHIWLHSEFELHEILFQRWTIHAIWILLMRITQEGHPWKVLDSGLNVFLLIKMAPINNIAALTTL